MTEPRAFNLMFVTYVGAIQDESGQGIPLPGTVQGIFLNYKNVLDTTAPREEVPSASRRSARASATR